MRELRFRTDLYTSAAVSLAVQVFSEHGRIDRESSDDAEVVRLSAAEGVDETELVGEFANYVLGATVDRKGPAQAEGES